MHLLSPVLHALALPSPPASRHPLSLSGSAFPLLPPTVRPPMQPGVVTGGAAAGQARNRAHAARCSRAAGSWQLAQPLQRLAGRRLLRGALVKAAASAHEPLAQPHVGSPPGPLHDRVGQRSCRSLRGGRACRAAGSVSGCGQAMQPPLRGAPRASPAGRPCTGAAPGTALCSAAPAGAGPRRSAPAPPSTRWRPPPGAPNPHRRPAPAGQSPRRLQSRGPHAARPAAPQTRPPSPLACAGRPPCGAARGGRQAAGAAAGGGKQP